MIQQGDFALIYTSAPFTLASDVSVTPIDSEMAVQTANNVWLKIGSGTDSPVILHAGKFLVERANQELLTDILPMLIHIKAGDDSISRVRTLLTMNESEAKQPGWASEFIAERLAELILVEILRTGRSRIGDTFTGLLAGLAHTITEPAIVAMHKNVAHDWTVEELAKLCAVSRSSFAAKFNLIVGKTPIAYLLQWRMALAKHELSCGTKSIGEIAFAIGFQSPSAFTTAFTRAVGCSPTQFMRSARA